MEPVYVRVLLFDPLRVSPGGEVPLVDNIEVDIARFDPYTPHLAQDALPLKADPTRGLFWGGNRRFHPDRSYFFRVRFLKQNFSPGSGLLLSPPEIRPRHLPLFCPARFPYWDSGWDDGYTSNEFFGDTGPLRRSTPDEPLVLRIPYRRLFVIGHRGSPYHLPENTIASFRRALDQGANGLEFDLCLTRDRHIVVFHDPRPDAMRLLFEDFPYELVSPRIEGNMALIHELRGDEYRIARRRRIFSADAFDIAKLRLEQVRSWFRYRHVGGEEHEIPSLEEFLTFASENADRLHLLFFDIKSPRWNTSRHRSRFALYGRLLGMTLKKFARLPEYLVIANEDDEVLRILRENILAAGEPRCSFAYDAAGSATAMFGLARNPLTMARKLGTTVISVGTRFRAGDLEEILEAIRDRDYRQESPLELVLHWTINDAAGMYRSYMSGVNGIVTDRPDAAVALLQKQGVFLGYAEATVT
jgi:glycerophosphoryl diester phosphodiesterase